MSISVIIPARDKAIWRLKRVAKQFSHKLIKEVIIVDYCSKKPVKIDGGKIKVIRYDKYNEWNKAHAINLGFKESVGDYILTIDADIILEDGYLDKLVLDKNVYSYSGTVRRIDKKKVSNDFTYMWDINSRPWINGISYSKEMYGLANGGLQIYPRKLLDNWNGIDENLVYSGGMDNITNLMAKKMDMNIVQLPIKLLHIEHDSKKHDNFPQEERLFAMYLTSKRGDYLNSWIISPTKNKFFGKMSGPCYTTFNKEQEIFNNNKEEIEKLANNIDNKNAKIMIAIINNTGTLQDRFVRSLFDMYNLTKNTFPNINIRFIKACQVNHMRNIAVNRAIEEDFDYLIQLDVDHYYESDTIIKLMAHDKDFVTVPTKQRIAPFMPTQYLKFMDPIKSKGNAVFVENKEGLIKIECSGPVAMLMKVDKLKKLKFPYFYMDYSYGFENTMGGDYAFCRSLKENGLDLWLDPTINCPHFVNALVGSFGSEAEITLDNGRQ